MEEKKPKIALKTLFFKDTGGYSSKRFLGVIGFLVCVIVFIIAFIFKLQIPEFGDLLLTVSASLVGLDSVASIFKKSVNK